MIETSFKRIKMIKPLALITIFLFLMIFSSNASAALLGDVNNDGIINVQDVVFVNNHVLGTTILTNTQKLVADVNGDGIINILDVTLITQMSLGLITEFPILPTPALSLPTNNASVVSSTINFQWTPSSGANMYQLEVTSISDGVVFKNQIIENVTNSTQYGFPNDGTQYRWRVRAGNNNVWGSWSEYRTFTNGTLPTTLTAPTLTSPLSGTNVSATWVNFQWNESVGASKYELEIYRVSDGALFSRNILGNVNSSRNYDFLNDGEQYRWRVRAGSSDNWSPWSDYWYFHNGDLPAIPVLVSPANEKNTHGTSILFEWLLSSGATKYELEIRKAIDNSVYRTVSLGNVSDTLQYSFPNDGTQYKWAVRAGNNKDWSPWSGYRTITNGFLFAAPTQLSPVANATVNGLAINFQWSLVNLADRYHLEITNVSKGTVRNVYPGDVGSVTQAGFLDDVSEYKWRVRAGNVSTWGDWSPLRSFTNGAFIPAPQLHLPLANATVPHDGANRIRFEWFSVDDADQYELEIVKIVDGTIRNINVADSGANITARNVAGFDNGEDQFKWRVRALQGDEAGAWSKYRHFINETVVAGSVITTLVSPSINARVPGDEIEFKWTATQSGPTYNARLQVINANTGTVVFNAPVGPNTFSRLLAGFPNDGTHYMWRVRSSHGGVVGGWTLYRNFTNGGSDWWSF